MSQPIPTPSSSAGKPQRAPRGSTCDWCRLRRRRCERAGVGAPCTHCLREQRPSVGTNLPKDDLKSFDKDETLRQKLTTWGSHPAGHTINAPETSSGTVTVTNTALPRAPPPVTVVGPQVPTPLQHPPNPVGMPHPFVGFDGGPAWTHFPTPNPFGPLIGDPNVSVHVNPFANHWMHRPQTQTQNQIPQGPGGQTNDPIHILSSSDESEQEGEDDGHQSQTDSPPGSVDAEDDDGSSEGNNEKEDTDASDVDDSSEDQDRDVNQPSHPGDQHVGQPVLPNSSPPRSNRRRDSLTDAIEVLDALNEEQNRANRAFSSSLEQE
jgi:hypothetical protein